MARMELTNYDRVGIRLARRVLDQADRLDMSDDLEMARTIGALQAAVKGLLEILEEEK